MKYQAVSGGREIVISPAYGYYIPATVVERGERDYEDKKDGLLAVCLSDIFRLWELCAKTFQPPLTALLQKQELKEMLVEALKTLTDNEQKVITLYYYEELTLKEISQILSVSESRVSQLHTKALQKIKDRLGDAVDLLNLF